MISRFFFNFFASSSEKSDPLHFFPCAVNFLDYFFLFIYFEFFSKMFQDEMSKGLSDRIICDLRLFENLFGDKRYQRTSFTVSKQTQLSARFSVSKISLSPSAPRNDSLFHHFCLFFGDGLKIFRSLDPKNGS